MDDHPLIREALTAAIEQEPDLVFDGEADGVASALKAIRTHTPDVVLLDLSLQDGHGLALIKRVIAIDPSTKILVVSTYEETLYAERVLRQGAQGYVEKLAGAEVIMEAIKTVLAGNIYLSAAMHQRVALAGHNQDTCRKQSALDRLSNREAQVFDLIGQGMTGRRIAELLHLSIKTVDSHRANIKKKLNVNSAFELTRLALRRRFEPD